MRSIQSRLATGLLLSLIVLLIGQWLVVASSIQDLSQRYIVAQLVHATDTLVAAVNFQAGQPALLDNSRIDPIYSKPFSGHYYKIMAGTESFRSRSLWDEALPISDLEAGETRTRNVAGPQGQQLLLLSSAFQKQGKLLQLSVAEDITPIAKDIRQFLWLHGAVSSAILILLIIIQSVIVRQSLRPIEQARIQLQDLASGIIEALDEGVPAELYPLVHEINTLLQALQLRLQRSRHASGNLAHALKGPLTLLSQLAEHALISGNHDLRQRLLEYTGNIQDIIDRELKRARIAGTGVAGRQAKLKPELEDLVGLLQTLYRDKSLTIHTQVDDACVSTLDREDLHEILGNLLDNACKWARSTVIVKAECEKGLTLHIEDDGPGIPEPERERMLSRGQRLDESSSGHGLGLAIVKEAVAQYAGRINLQQSPTLHGLAVTIHIPVTRSSALPAD